MNDTTSPSHPPPSSDSVQPGASYAQCGDHAKCFERLRDSIVSWFVDNFGTGNVTVIPPGARLLVHLPEEALDHPELWGKVLSDVADLLDVRVAAVCKDVDVTVIAVPEIEPPALASGDDQSLSTLVKGSALEAALAATAGSKT